MQIAIDGPAGSGKSTVAKIIAAKEKMLYLDTGAMYRAVTYGVMQAGLSRDDLEKIAALAQACTIDFEGSSVFFNGEDVTQAIRTPEVTANVSFVSAIPAVRARMTVLQREIAESRSVVMDGRDIGSVVLPNAECKIYLDADPGERAKRRLIEFGEKGIEADYDSVLADMIKRDESDRNREVAPLVCAADAVVIDTTGLSIDAVVSAILEVAASESGKTV